MAARDIPRLKASNAIAYDECKARQLSNPS
jgi:hypothetical protein